VALHVPTGTYLALDRSAAFIFDLLAESGSAAVAARRLAAEVDIPPEQAEADVGTVVEALVGLRRGRGRRPRRPGLVTGAGELAKWWRLPLGLRWAVVRVVAMLCLVEVGFRVCDIERLSTLVGVPLAEDGPGAGSPAQRGASEHLTTSESRLLSAIDWVAARWLFPGTCLRRALLTGHVLRHRRPVLRLGLMPDGVTAHAWVEADGITYGFEDVSGVFEPVR
jgi:hypothetical protein